MDRTAGTTSSKISMGKLQELMRDPDIPDSQIRAYFTAYPDASRPFSPAIIPNPELVDVTAPDDELEGAMIMAWGNNLSRQRRQRKFRRRRQNDDRSPVLVSEGDSWFQFPLLLDDVIDQLFDQYNVWSVDAAGDTLENMVRDQPEYMGALEEHAGSVRAFLFSGAGNDFLGEDSSGRSNLSQILRSFKSGKPAEWYIETDVFARKLRFVEDCYRKVLSEVETRFPRLPVVCHGYDYAIPGGTPSDPRHPIYAAQDKWLARPLRDDLGIADHGLQRAIIKLLIDKLNSCIASLCGGNHAGGVFKNAWHVDSRNALGSVSLWADELHPTNDGFARVAGKFRAVIGTMPAFEAESTVIAFVGTKVSEEASSTPYADRLAAVTSAELDRFGTIAETDEPLRSRIAEYCLEIGIEEPDDTADFAWSAAFVSWCVKRAGAVAGEFKFDPMHAVFVKAAIANAEANTGVFRARPIDAYRPKVGDIIHANRNNGAITYKQARTRSNYPSHSAIVVEIGSDHDGLFARTIGGNEGDSIRSTKVRLTADGYVAQRPRNSYICVIETLKVDAAPEQPATGLDVLAPEEAFVCEASGEIDSALEQAADKPRVDRFESTDHKSSRNGRTIDHIVVHYTTSRNINGSINHFKHGSPRTSAHYIVGRDGELVQLVPDADCAWHAGSSDMNARSIGIEHVAAAGDAITAAQSKTSLALIRWLMQEYHVPLDKIIPHVWVKPTSCCGDLFKEFGGGANKPRDVQKAALHNWLAANGIPGPGPEALALSPQASLEVAPQNRRTAMATIIVNYEARRDAAGRIKVYRLPDGDGGGRYEVAGINERYHKEECDELVRLIESGRHAEAEEKAREFIARYTDTAAGWCNIGPIEFYLRDCIFNRGPGGAARILQRALGVAVDGGVGPKTREALAEAQKRPEVLLDDLRTAREWYERVYARRSETSPFWQGLVNRWNKAGTDALKFTIDDGAHEGTKLDQTVGLTTAPLPQQPVSSVMRARMELASDLTIDVGADIDFINRSPDIRSFADIGTASPVDDPEKMLKGWRSLKNGLQPEENLEAVIERDTSLPAAFLQLMAEQRRTVGRISAFGTNYKGVRGTWAGTGFLVAKNILLTNHHVLNSVEVAKAASIDFDYEVSTADLTAGKQEPSMQPGKRSYRLDPGRLFLTSPASNGGLDFTFVWVDTDSEGPASAITMRRAAFAIAPGEQAFVIHHPQGHGKRVSVDDVDVLDINATVVRYTSDTMPGSSGSPVFDRQGRLFALHHASRGMSINRPDGRLLNVLNEGIKIAAIVSDLERRQSGAERPMAESVRGAVLGSDTMAGFFGSLGRTSSPAMSGVEAVVDTYRGSDADIDVGFWNIEWLANRYHDAAKLREAAALITDLSLDVWGLEEVSPPAVAALVEELDRSFGERYGYALSEPHAAEGKQSTAVIWKKKTVTGGREEWPEEIESYWRLRSTDDLDGLEAVEGKIFDRYPGLFRFASLGRRAPFDFYVVPLHLKAMAEGSKRRQLASRLLARAVRLMTERYRKETDWILGGDFNAELTTNDFKQLLLGDLKPMSAADEQTGAFSYIKSPRSLIDHIFLSPNLVRRTDGDAFFIVAKDKSVDSYAAKLSDHRPVLVRLSLSKRSKQREAAADIDTEIDNLIARAVAV